MNLRQNFSLSHDLDKLKLVGHQTDPLPLLTLAVDHADRSGSFLIWIFRGGLWDEAAFLERFNPVGTI